MISVRRHRKDPRGFTIVELLTVIAVIGILAAAATPSFVAFMRDRRVRTAATTIADLYRMARARAMGRGSAILVRYDASAPVPTPSTPVGRFVMREAVAGAGAAFHTMLPSSSCLATDWSTGSTNSKHVSVFDERIPRFEPAELAFFDGANTSQSYVEICYTPRGRTYVRFGAAGTWQTLNSVPAVQVTNPSTSMRRFVVLPPNGAARLEARLQ